MAIQFIYGTQSQYDAQVASEAIVDEALYFINDTQRMYRGKELMLESTPIKFTTDVPTEYAEDTIYVVTTTADDGTKVMTVYISDGETLDVVSSTEDELTSDQVMSVINKLTSEDLANWEENATDDQLVTAAALGDVLSWFFLADSDATVSAASFEELVSAISEAKDGATIQLTNSIELTSSLELTKSVTIQGSDNVQITANTTEAFVVTGAEAEEDVITVTFSDVDIINATTESRASCIRTTTGYFNLVIDSCSVECTSGSMPSVVYIDDTTEAQNNVTISNSTVTAGSGTNTGDAVFARNKVNMTIDNSSLYGWSALYLKGKYEGYDGVGTSGSVVDVKNSTLTGVNNQTNSSDNAFGTVVFEDGEVTVNVDNSELRAESTKGAAQSILFFSDYHFSGETANTVNLTNGTTLTLEGEGASYVSNVSGIDHVITRDNTVDEFEVDSSTWESSDEAYTVTVSA